MEQGLPDNQIKAIHQIPDGSLWVGTRNGLARFADGKFTVFNHLNTPEMISDDCKALGEDSSGNLWMVNNDGGGLLRYRAGQFDAFKVRSSVLGIGDPSPSRLPGGGVLCLTPRRDGGIWFGGRGGICHFQNGWFTGLPNAPALNGLNPIGLLEEPLGVLWILGDSGAVYRRSLISEEVETVVPPSSNVGLVHQAIQKDTLGNVWVLSFAPESSPSARLVFYRNGTVRTNTDHVVPPNVNLTLAQDQFGGVWTALWKQSLGRFREGELTRYAIPSGEADDSIRSLLVDRDGNLWAGTESSGLLCFQPRHLSLRTTRDGLANDNTWAICEGRDGSVWIATDGGLSRFQDGKFTNFSEREGLTRQEVRSVAEDNAGTVWVGTMNGLFAFRDGRFTKHEFPGQWFEGKVRTIVATRAGDLWVGTAVGLNHLHDGIRTKYSTTNGLAHIDVRVLLEDHAGNLWIGTAGGGLQCFRDGKFTTFNTTNGLSANSVWSLHEDTAGVLWIGTEGGLNRLQDGRIKAFTVREGLAADSINGILEDDAGRLWLSHDHGLFWVRKADFENVAAGHRSSLRSVSYDETDGLLRVETNGQKSNPAGCKTRDGRLWFPTPEGVAIIDPAQVADAAVPPLASVEEVIAEGKVMFSRNPVDRALEVRDTNVPPTSATDQPVSRPGAVPPLRFAPGTARVLEFRFLANSFIAPEKSRFKYRLRGLSDAWLDAGLRRSITFTDLRPGDYTLELLAANHHGVWSERPASVSFQLVPHFFQTLWFRVSAVMAALLLSYAGVSWRLRELRKLNRLEQQSAISAERSRIAKDLHDGLGADLTRLALLADLAEGESSGAAAGHRQKLSRSSRETARTLKDMIWIANPANDTVEGLVSRISQTAEDFLGDARIRCRLDIPLQLPQRSLSLEQRRNLLLVAREAINNIIKHAAATEVCLRVEADQKELRLTIEDNGRGFDPASARPEGLGLGSMKRRVESSGGRFQFVRRPEGGTRILITLKFGMKGNDSNQR
jgi:signal transduction histidine kinase/ligand-binding sensor domain-containing protein